MDVFALRLRLAREPAWVSWVSGLIVRAVAARQRWVTRARGLAAAPTGRDLLATLDRVIRRVAQRLPREQPDDAMADDPPELSAQLQALIPATNTVELYGSSIPRQPLVAHRRAAATAS